MFFFSCLFFFHLFLFIEVAKHPENTTKGSSNSPAAREKIPEQSETTIQVPTAAWISLVVILLPFTITVFIHYLRACTKGHLGRELLNKTSESELDEESVKQSFGSDNSIEREEVLAKGKFSEVWKGSWKGKSIAVKIFPPAAISSWQREHHMYSILLGKHSSILQMVSLKSQQIGDFLYLVTEFCENGSLRDYLLRTVSLQTMKVKSLTRNSSALDKMKKKKKAHRLM